MDPLLVKIGGNPSVTQTRTSAFGIASTCISVPPREGGDDYNNFFSKHGLHLWTNTFPQGRMKLIPIVIKLQEAKQEEKNMENKRERNVENKRKSKRKTSGTARGKAIENCGISTAENQVTPGGTTKRQLCREAHAILNFP